MKTLLRLLVAAAAFFIASAQAQQSGKLGAHQILANPTASAAIARPTNIIDILNTNAVYMTDYMAGATCDGTSFYAGTGGASLTTITVSSMINGIIAVGQTVSSGAGTVTSVITGLGTGTGGAGTYTVSPAITLTNGTLMIGGTDVATPMQQFLTAVAANGSAPRNLSVTGVFAPGNCFVKTTPVFTANSNAIPIQYRLIGYGTVITTDPFNFLTGLGITRGTFLTHGDEQRTITVEGLGVSARDNAKQQWGINVADTRVTILRNNCYAGADNAGGPVNQGNFACYYYHQIDSTDPNTGAFYGRIIDTTMKGTGTAGTQAMPSGIRLDGSAGNAMVIDKITCAQGVYCIRVFNPCAADNDNCAYMANGLVVRDSYIENFATCIDFHTTLPGRSKLVGGMIAGNTFENCTGSDIDIATIALQSVYPMTVIGNTDIATTGVFISNTNSIQLRLPPAKTWPAP